MASTFNEMVTTTTSSEVPITLEDYMASPSSYPKLEQMQKTANTVTEADCADSGYTKVVQTTSTDIIKQQMQSIFNPTD